MYRHANAYIKSIFPNFNTVQDSATEDKFRDNVNDMLRRVNYASQNNNAKLLCINLLTETTYVLIHLLYGFNGVVSLRPSDLNVVGGVVRLSTNSGIPGDYTSLVKKSVVSQRYEKNIDNLISCDNSKDDSMLSEIYDYPIMIFMRKQFKYSNKLKSATAKLRVVLGVSGDETSGDIPLFHLMYNSLKDNVNSPFCTGLLQKQISARCSKLVNFHTF
jgi:hypothetical protein